MRKSYKCHKDGSFRNCPYARCLSGKCLYRRVPRKIKKAVRQASALDSGNPACWVLKHSKRRWITIYRGYKRMLPLTMADRRKANQIKIKNL